MCNIIYKTLKYRECDIIKNYELHIFGIRLILMIDDLKLEFIKFCFFPHS